MGVRIFENECYNTSDDDDECLSQEPEMQKTLNMHFSKHQNTTTNLFTSKDLVGNCKEFRIENNKCNLRIIGNNNRIRITNNLGNLQIIGNNTRLKITKNNGHIKYTGNEGRICLGSESMQQTVDYIGCNGLLKVVNSMELNNKTPRSKNDSCGKNNNNANNNSKLTTKSVNDKPTNFTGNTIHGRSPQQTSSSSTTAKTTTTTATAKNSPLKPKQKSASSDSINDFKNAQWQEFNNLMQQEGWQHLAKVSLPNLNDNLKYSDACECKCKQKQTKSQKSNNLNIKTENQSKRNSNNNTSNNTGSKNIQINNHTNIVNNFGDIIIKNSVNVSIA